MIQNFHSGTSNLVLPVPNKTFFPEAFRDRTRLSYYASLFNSVEINASFYKMPGAKTVLKWSGEVPDDFVFSFKLNKTITHTLQGAFDLAPVPAFMGAIGATTKRGCLLIQLPPKFRPDLFQLTALLTVLKPYGWRIAVEFRQPDWYTDDVFELLSSFDAAVVLHDMRRSATPQVLTASHIYIRFHGPEDGYRGSYAADHLAEYANYIQGWLGKGKSVYAYFNNTLGAAVQNLQSLNHLVSVNY
ncbi:DUF72 domain-containing protein [Mucilaginibacter rubeus]|uniref:DUF72 domain-containing protein n=1 Tax=Mucilaginibacter rubeus TaxID=2027860 RepID=A0A5C1HYS8_9SPHI|nr:DUF72 domain-containing protein [Mucilaginibacter rubeus]QEM09978.1 DUF72 domain-containing protein [Mucilaginibacter rubeus]